MIPAGFRKSPRMARMFRRTDPQQTLASLEVLLSPRKIARLEARHWAGAFRRKALPVLLGSEATLILL